MAFLSLFSKAPNYDSWSCLRPPLFVFSLTQGRKKVKFYPILWHRGHYWQPIVTNGCLFSSPLPPSWRRYRDAKEIPPSVLDSEHKTLDLWGRRCFLSSFFALQMKTKKRGDEQSYTWTPVTARGYEVLLNSILIYCLCGLERSRPMAIGHLHLHWHLHFPVYSWWRHNTTHDVEIFFKNFFNT